MSISSSALLVRLSISTWTATKKDQSQADALIARNGAQGSQAAKVHKNLMAGTRVAKDINDYAANCRLWNSQATLAWEDRGNRLLPTSMFLEYKAELNKRRDTFNAMVDRMEDNYSSQIAVAQNYLGGLFNPNDYPAMSEIRQKYSFDAVFTPVPDSGHFLVDIPAHELEETKRSCDQETERRLEEAMSGAWARLHKMLVGMSDKLEEGDGDEKRRWYESFIDNPKELCALLTHLNVTQDPQLEQARRDLETALVGADIDVIKESPLARQNIKSKVDGILEQFDW